MPDDPLTPLAEHPDVVRAVAAARLAVDRVARHRVLRRQGAAVREESLVRGAVGATSLELGRPVDRGVVSRLGPDGETVDESVLRGALRAYAAIGELVGVWRQAPRQALARLHTLAARGVVDDAALGRPRADPVVGDRLLALAETVSATRAPGLVVAAVVHGELASLRAFGTLDTVVGLAAARVVLVERGVDAGAYAVPEVAWAADPSATRHALSAYAGGSAEGVVAWVVAWGDALERGSAEAAAIAEAVLRG